MSRTALVGNITAMLADADFLVSDRCSVRPKSFDLAARRGEDLVLLKVLGNIDAFNPETGAELRRLGKYLSATPMVIGLRTRNEDLKPGVVYFRHGVPVFNPDTAYDLFVEEVPPLIYAAPGGLYVSIDGDLLADEREERGWSLGRLATELGAVSKATGRRASDVLTGHSSFTESAEKRAELMSSIGRVTKTRSVYFTTEQTKRDAVGGTAIVSCAELADIDDPESIRELIQDRGAEPES